jgi:hypothetical protein
MTTQGIYIEIASEEGRCPEYASDLFFEESTSFKQIILEALNHWGLNQNLDLSEWTVFTQRASNTRFFPIGANDKQIKAFEESKNPKKSKIIPPAEYKWSYGKILEKYKVAAFHIERKMI